MLTQRGTADSSYHLDLFDYLRLLLHRWRWVAGPTLAALACAGLYLLLTAPVYQARTTLLPPTPASIAGYNQDNGRAGLPVWDSDAVYSAFQKYLFSDSLRLSFFRETVLPGLSEEPVKPRAVLVLLAALLIGLIAGTLLASVLGAATMRKGEAR